jgi:hypothetical protein
MDGSQFDAITRALGTIRSRRAAVGAALALGLGVRDADARKKRRRKPLPPPTTTTTQPPPPLISNCQGLNTPCGGGIQTGHCECFATPEGPTICANWVYPPNGRDFQFCTRTADCPPGQICNRAFTECLAVC